ATPDSGHVAAGMAETLDESELYRILAAAENDRNGLSRRFGGDRRRQAAGRDDHGDLALDQLGGELRQQVRAAFGPAVFDREVLTVDVAAFLQALAESFDEMRAFVGPAAVEKADERNRGALRQRCEGPCEGHERDGTATIQSVLPRTNGEETIPREIGL